MRLNLRIVEHEFEHNELYMFDLRVVGVAELLTALSAERGGRSFIDQDVTL